MSNFTRLMTHAARYGWMTTPLPDDVLDQLLADLPRAGRAADLGCGGGLVARRLAARGLDVLAIDSLAEVCAALIARRDSPSFDVHCGTIERYSGARDFDVVCCLGTELNETPRMHAKALVSWLRPGGVAISGTWVPARSLPNIRQAHTAAGLVSMREYIVPISVWLSHEKSLADRVRMVANDVELANRLDVWLGDALPHLAGEQHFAVFRGIRREDEPG